MAKRQKRVREEGLEPSCREAPDPKSGVSAIPPPPRILKKRGGEYIMSRLLAIGAVKPVR